MDAASAGRPVDVLWRAPRIPELADVDGGFSWFNLSRNDSLGGYPAQAWVGTLRQQTGRYAVMHPGAPIGDACDGAPFDNASPGPLQTTAGATP